MSDIDVLSPDDLNSNIEKTAFLSQVHKTKSPSLESQTKTSIVPSPIRTSTLPINKLADVENKKPTSKVPIRSHSLSQSRSRNHHRTIDKRFQ